jgi:hypothetical protein
MDSSNISNCSPFPENLNLEECREAITGCPGFTECKKDDYIVFNYSYAFSRNFPDPKKASTTKEARILQIRRYNFSLF